MSAKITPSKWTPPCGARADNTEKSISVFRIFVCLSLLVAAVVCGTVSYLVLTASERKNYRNQYHAATKQMKQSIEVLLSKYHSAADHLALTANMQFPNSSTWPFVGIPNFNLLDESIMSVTGSVSGTTILPIVPTELLPEFNAYAKEFLAEEEWIAQYPQIFDIFNLGVWNGRDGVPTEITDGFPYTFEGRELIAPLLNAPIFIAESGFVLANAHGEEANGIAMDDILTCTEQGHTECASLSNYLIGSHINGVPDTSIYRPIFSIDSPDGDRKVLGFSTVGFSWEQELQRLVVGDDLNGLDVVLSSFQQPSDTLSRTYTYKFKNGGAAYDGEGDKHDSSYSDMAVHVPLSLIDSNTETSFKYVLTIYPNSEYENQFHTQTPLFTSLGFIGMIVFTSIIFFLYDYLVHENVKLKDHILRMKRDFVRFISHEIRTPLNTVSVGLQLIYDGLLAQQGSEEMTHSDILDLTMDVQASTSTAVSVLNDLLNFDKLQSGELQIAREPVHVWQTVVTVVRSFRIPAKQKNIAVELQFENFVNEAVSCNELIVTGDKFKLCHILRNLMSNALKFTEDGGSIIVKVLWATADEGKSRESTSPHRQTGNAVVPEVSFASDDYSVTISVTDNGYGLTAEQLGMLFRDGVQFNPNKLQAGQGSGLGLYLSHAIAVLHDGKMWASSEGENKGSTFNVQLPVQVGSLSRVRSQSGDEAGYTDDEHISSAEIAKRLARAKSSRSDSHSSALHSSRESITECRNPTVTVTPQSTEAVVQGKVLVVDDAASNRKVVSRILSKHGYECTEAKDGKEAIKIVEEKNNPNYFSCVLMDYEMPVLNGPDATAALRSRGYPLLPIYGLTGNVMVEDIDHFLQSGANHVLGKPFQISEFKTFMVNSKV